MNPLRWVAASRRRLATATLVAYALAFAVAVPLAAHLRDVSASPIADFWVMTAWLGILAAGSLFLGVLLGDRLLPGRWRERVILGREVQLPGTDDDPALAMAVTKSYLLHFSALTVGALALSAMALEAVTGGFFAEYQRLGYARATLRGDDTAAKLATVERLSEVQREQNVRDSLALLRATWDDPAQPLEVRAASIRSLGRLGHSLVTSIDAWDNEGVKEHWEFDLVRELRSDLLPLWRERLATADPALAGPMALALGRYRDFDSAPALLARATTGPTGASPTWRQTVTALGLLHPLDILAPLGELATAATDPQDFTALAWAVGEPMRRLPLDQPPPPAFDRLIEAFGALAASGATPVHRCDAVYVLYKTRDARIVEPLLAAFDAQGADMECPTTHVDVSDRAPHVSAHGEPFRVRVLKALAVVAVGQPRVLEWARSRVDDASLSDVVRLELKQLVALTEAGAGQ